jgi:hypothetical protein
MSTGMNSGSFDEVSNATAANTEASQYNTTSGTEADATSLLESNQMVRVPLDGSVIGYLKTVFIFPLHTGGFTA